MSTSAEAASAADSLQARLKDPQVAEGLNRLLDHLDTISFAVESADEFLARSEVIAESLTQGVAELRQADGESAAECLQQAPQMLQTGMRLTQAAADVDTEALVRSQVLRRLSCPETLETLNRLLDRLPLLVFVAESLEQLLSRGETIADNVSDAVGELKLEERLAELASAVSVLDSLPKLREAGERLLHSDLLGDRFSRVLDAAVTMIDSGMLDPELVGILGDTGRKAVETWHEVSSRPVPPTGGLMGTLRASRDPDVQKTIGFFFAFAKAFAKHLK